MKAELNKTTHFKMYKSGRKWVVAGLTAVSLLTATGAVAHADNDASQAPVTNVDPQSATTNTNQVASASASTQVTSSADSSAQAQPQSAAPQTNTTAAYAAQADTQQS